MRRRCRPDVLADAAGVSSANVRKDLSHLGSYGTRGIGYDVAHLIHEIRQALGLTQHWSILIAGVGNLGQALARYKGFAERGFRVAALIDVDPAKVGSRLDGMQVRHLDDLPKLVRSRAGRDRRDRDPGDGRAGRRGSHGAGRGSVRS